MDYKKITTAFKLLLFAIIAISTISVAQTTSEQKRLSDLKKIFNNLEYNTIAYNDLKVKWVIKDPSFVRDVFGRFIVNNALRLNGKKINSSKLKKLAQNIFEGKVVLDLRKRYYDDEIEFFAFVPEGELDKENPNYLFDPVYDGFYLREIVGKNIYQELQKRQYYFSDITKKEYDVKPGFFFDINMEMINPYLMFWSTTSDYRNKYLATVFGKWGMSEVYFPAWTSPEYFVGTQVTYYKYLTDDPEEYTYKVAIGTGVSSGIVYPTAQPASPLMKSADDIYFKINGDVFKYLFPKVKGYYLDFSGSFSYSDYTDKEFGKMDTTSFYSVRDFVNFSVTKRKLVNLFDLGQLMVGLGVSSHSLKHLKYFPGRKNLVDLDGHDFFDSFTHFVNAKIGVERYGGLIQHQIIFNVSYSSEGYGVGGVSLKAMLSDTFGIRITYNSFFSLDTQKYPFRTDTQLIFSPIIRINY